MNEEVGDSQPVCQGVGWEAVGSGATNARELLGVPGKRERDARKKKATRMQRAGRKDETDVDADGGERVTVDVGGEACPGTEDSSSLHSEEWERLDVDWDPAEEDSGLAEHEAGSRQMTQTLLERLITDAGLPLTIHVKYDADPDPTVRFHDRPRVFLLGSAQAAQTLRRHLPRGFGVQRLNATASSLTRVASPPPLPLSGEGGEGVGEEEEEEEEEEETALTAAQESWLESDGAEGTQLDEQFASGSLSLHEYRAAMAPREAKLRQRTEVDDMNAAFELGMRLLFAKGVRKDPINGCRFIMNAAAQGHCLAQTELGVCYARGIGLAPDPAKAVEWWKLASAGNDILPDGVPAAMHNLAVAYGEGLGVRKDYVLACHWHKQAAKRGDQDSQYNLAYYYTVGKGVRLHARKSAYWLLKAATQGCADAALHLAARYWRAQGVPHSPAKTVQWLRKAARGRRLQAALILEAIEHGGSNLTAIDALFPLTPAPSRMSDDEMTRAVAELQGQMRTQLLRAQERAAAAQRKRAREDIVPGVRLGQRLEAALDQAVGEASMAALNRHAHVNKRQGVAASSTGQAPISE